MGKTSWAICLVVACVMVVADFASAGTIRGIDIDFVSIGNAGNAGDTVVDDEGLAGYGAVGYNYRISKYEVTNAQWNAFTAAAGIPNGNDGWIRGGAYDQNAYHTGAQQPSDCVSWYEAAQFCNYLTSGDKSKGAYLFSGNNTNPGDFQGINRTAAEKTYGTIYVLPTEDEWYKAAYFKPDGSGYSLYANGTNTPPSTSQTCYSVYSTPWNIGAGTQEQNGTYDMMGNILEWNETLIGTRSVRGLRGGAHNYSYAMFKSSYRNIANSAYYDYENFGFRVASVPEPTTLLLLGVSGLMMRKFKK